MFNYLPLQWLFLFYFYSFFGWCFESTYVSFLQKKPVNRGFMRGPFLPLYGSGGIMMLLVSSPFYDNIILVYIAGCIGATLLEYVTGVVMEALFKVRYWDYSDKFLNFQGQICLESTLVWGLLTVIFTHFLQIPIEKMLLSIPYNILSIVTIILTVYISCDFMVAFKTALDLRDVLVYMEKAKEEMSKMQKRLDVIVAFKGEEVRETIGQKVDDISTGIGNRVDSISNGIGSRVDSISNGLGNRVDNLSDSLEKSFASIKEKITIDPSSYMQSVKDEVGELYAKYRIMMDRLTPSPVKSFFDWYRNRTILGNPNMVSNKFKTSMEEVKEKAASLRNKK
ncbi:Uncharacterized membrane protein [Butyrivibrio hungatei DSM 14810]|uniref:Uncharacterized membrane protein n=1 Tax=Butyrivibrio hungatei DSM 14810 TaxID=1121132 RepID=A0A1M7RRN6_9FIRM|nr:hypothetical protein [Butyrivibrio hungatei]SHN48850.1 Uncharacterized membrane protein [Butyrivibrio hungatei DSM 14810]